MASRLIGSICGLPNGSECFGCVMTNGWSSKSIATSASVSVRSGLRVGIRPVFPWNRLVVRPRHVVLVLDVLRIERRRRSRWSRRLTLRVQHCDQRNDETHQQDGAEATEQLAHSRIIAGVTQPSPSGLRPIRPS